MPLGYIHRLKKVQCQAINSTRNIYANCLKADTDSGNSFTALKESIATIEAECLSIAAVIASISACKPFL